MTVTVTSTFVRAAGNGVTTVVNFPFLVTSSGDLVVRDILDSTGTPTTLTLTTHYTVQLSVTGEGGTVTFLSPLVAGHTYDIRSNIPATQGEDIRNQGRFLPEVHEGVFDKAVRLIQDLARKVSQSIQAPDYEASPPNFVLPPASQRALNYLYFDASGNAVVASGTGGGDSTLRADLANTTTAGKGSDMVSYRRTSAEIAAGVTPVNYAYLPLHAFRYLSAAQITDVTSRALTLDVRAVLQSMISVAQVSGGEIYLPAGSYLIRRVAGLDARFNGIVIPYTNVFGYVGHIKIVGDGRATVFYAGDNSMTIVRWSDSDGVMRDLALDGNSKTGVTGISLISSNTASAAISENIDHNKFRIDIRNCAEGCELESPSLGGCYYNLFEGGIWQDNTRHIRLRDNATAKGANRNRFKDLTLVGGNCGVDIDGADTNMFKNVAFEAINSGTSPLGTPTAIRINSAGSLGAAGTANNVFSGCQCESNIRDLDCSNRRTHIDGGTIGSQSTGGVFGAVVGSALPDNMRGGDFVNTLREWLIGSITADGVYASQRLSSLSAQTCCEIGTSANAAGTFPFQNDGSLILKARRNASCGLAVRWGATSQYGWNGNVDGSLEHLGTVVDKPSTLQTVTDGSTILTNGAGQAVCNTATNRTGVILEAGFRDGQTVKVVSVNAGTITFATDATSNVLDGTAVTVAARRNKLFCWYAAGSRWVAG